MDNEKKGNHGFLSFLSGVLVVCAIGLLIHVCRFCYPEADRQFREVLGGLENGAARQAFYVMAEGLEEGSPIKETMKETVQVLFGKAD